MVRKIDKLLEAEYTVEQEGASHIQTVEVKAESEKGPEHELEALFS